MTRDAFEEAVIRIQPSVTQRHALVLYGLVRWLRPQVVVEVGAWLGYCTSWMARALQDVNEDGRLYVIDDFSAGGTSKDILRDNLQRTGTSRTVTILSGDSRVAAWPDHIDFAFIDGDHSREGIENDVRQVRERGATAYAVHDTAGWWGPKDHVDDFRKQDGAEWDMVEVTFDSGLAIFMRRPVKEDISYTETLYPTGKLVGP